MFKRNSFPASAYSMLTAVNSGGRFASLPAIPKLAVSASFANSANGFVGGASVSSSTKNGVLLHDNSKYLEMLARSGQMDVPN